MKVELTGEQVILKQVIINNLAIASDLEHPGQAEAFKKMSEAAHKLHMQLEPQPRHHAYMIENSGMEADHPEFYSHIHPVQDLLKYLEDTTANDDPIDHTIGKKFDFIVYSNRWGHKDNYALTRTKDGWFVEHLTYSGEDKRNEEMKVLYRAMQHESISFPRNVDSYLNSIWVLAKEKGLSHEEVQEMLTKVANWISETEMNAPREFLI